MVAVSHWLELWQVDTLLHAELVLKHCCILEAAAESRHPPSKVDGVPVTFLKYDRSRLHHCLRELEKAEDFVKRAREREARGGVSSGGGGGGGLGGKEEGVVGVPEDGEELKTHLAILHAECVYALTRVKVKLASTNPPPGE